MKSKSLTSFALASTLALASAGSLSAATIFTDNASNYGGVWNTGSNGGSGFGAWTLSSSGGTGGFAGSFIGDPTSAGITGMDTTSFGLYANPLASGAFVNAERGFANPLGVGDSFSFQWGINFDSNGGNKGFSIYSGGTSGAELINLNNAGSSAITINGTDVGFGYGNATMTWTITRTSATNLQVDATNRDVSLTAAPNYSGNITISGTAAPDSFKFYASGMDSGDNRQPYFNNLTLTVVPEPSSLSLLALSGLALLRRRRA
jgi:hypothetical protein